MLSVSKSTIAAAYDSWAKMPESKQGKPGGIDELTWFHRCIKRQLSRQGVDEEPTFLPRAKTTLSGWRRSNSKQMISQSGCQAIYQVCKYDVSPAKIFSTQTNFTDVAFLRGEILTKRKSNQMDDDGNEVFEICLPRISFRPSQGIEVTSVWLKRPGERGCKDDHVRIGRIEWGIFQAKLTVECDGIVIPSMESSSSSVDDLRIDDDPQTLGRWIISGPAGQLLRGDVYVEPFADLKCKEGELVEVKVSTSAADIQTLFTRDGDWNGGADDQHNARNTLISRVLQVFTDSADTNDVLLCQAKVRAASFEQ